MPARAEFGARRHFAQYMLVAALTGVVLGAASLAWDWSDITVRWATAIAVLLVVLLAPGPVAPRGEVPKPRRTAGPGSQRSS